MSWLREHFGFQERLLIGDHRAQMDFDRGALVVVQRARAADADADQLASSIMVRVGDIDARYRNASNDGIRIVRPLTDHPYGERQFTVRDFAGHVWTFTQTMFDADPKSWGGELVSK